MSGLNQNQKNKHGGPRPGAGRPKGVKDKLRVSDFFTPEEKEQLVAKVKSMVLDADKPDRDVAKFLWEQIFGKSTQRTELTGAEGEALKIVFDEVFKNK